MNNDSRQMSIEREQTWVSFHFENQGQLLYFTSSVRMHKYTYSNVVSEHIGDFSCLSLWDKPPVVSVELLWANLCIKDHHWTFRVWCWVLVVSLEQKRLWPKRKQWRMPQCESQHFLTQCKILFLSCLIIFHWIHMSSYSHILYQGWQHLVHIDKSFVKNERMKRQQATKSCFKSNMILILKINNFP